ncbi:MAG: NTP transferase domain-containing protein [Hyphomicrobium sp.]
MKVSVILLAAGSSIRFGENNKLLEDLEGTPLIRKTYKCLLNAGIEDIIVVTGPDEVSILQSLKGYPFRYVSNPRHAEGMGTSISCGISAVLSSTEAALILPADMPLMSEKVITELIHVFHHYQCQKIVCPRAPDGSQRNPVLWPKTFFPQLAALKGPRGGKHILSQYPDIVAYVSIQEAEAFLDIDTRADLETYHTIKSSSV